jgi:hypothetical protein
VDGTGSGSCPMAGFGISGVEPSHSVRSEDFPEQMLRYDTVTKDCEE